MKITRRQLRTLIQEELRRDELNELAVLAPGAMGKVLFPVLTKLAAGVNKSYMEALRQVGSTGKTIVAFIEELEGAASLFKVFALDKKKQGYGKDRIERFSDQIATRLNTAAQELSGITTDVFTDVMDSSPIGKIFPGQVASSFKSLAKQMSGGKATKDALQAGVKIALGEVAKGGGAAKMAAADIGKMFR